MTNYPNKFFKDMYLDYVNNYATIEVFAEHNGWSVDEAKAIVDLGREKHTQHTVLVSNMDRIKHLIAKYRDIKDELMEYDEAFHDPILFDLEGYEQENYKGLSLGATAEILETLETQVDACELLLAGFKKLNYEYS
jgi:hypothetical protein